MLGFEGLQGKRTVGVGRGGKELSERTTLKVRV